MTNIVCQNNSRTSIFQGMDKSESMVCLNCKSTLASCNSRTTCLASPPPAPCLNCQRCLMATTPCIAAGLVPYFPLPYVCRHWLSVSANGRNSLDPSCFHTHSCEKPSANEITLSHRPVSQIEITSTNPSILTGGAVQRLDIDATFKSETHHFSSRSNSPETNVVPDIIFSLNGVPVAKIQQPWSTDDDQKVLSKTKEDLETCGWFYGGITWQEAAALLANSTQGTFLIRNSSTSRCPYALSVQTCQGPTSIRIQYDRGQFWLDCERRGVTPQFGNIMKLVDYYREIASIKEINNTQTKIQETSALKNIWVDHKGRIFSPISITKPLLKNPSSLKHICRLSFNSKVNLQLFNELPSSLKVYMSKYTYGL